MTWIIVAPVAVLVAVRLWKVSVEMRATGRRPPRDEHGMTAHQWDWLAREIGATSPDAGRSDDCPVHGIPRPSKEAHLCTWERK